ncbi:MAG: toxin-antitoxin system HicB family antitoxin [Gammaproteobacteria bacterium]|jgi:antitoxin HicB|nr:toxin-antitoxin system HicB family antitoxin [Gammaproteobacteria bacterium]NBT43454.1 toxin-antitoxin system HicB family antitoxin [Gammaproteobacteria bacterium]NBY23884.1 toxin-antitoxin system HicB family antitoxin [Gammaproteobacteria bacterium]NDE35031.1 toxin-antitoxin system HicB family antitoxin [Gammaproteobacteria bacterium]NDE55891.1 toxin-antitoxin system HicB family antitoxin [Gammaproteobacteria bacterium]
MNDIPDYPFEVRPLSDSHGFLITFPDLPGCMADGDTVDEAIANGRDAVQSWILTAREFGDAVPSPGSGGEPGKFVQRLPRSMHMRLAARAKQEGVSLNTLVLSFIAEGLGSRETHV